MGNHDPKLRGGMRLALQCQIDLSSLITRVMLFAFAITFSQATAGIDAADRDARKTRGAILSGRIVREGRSASHFETGRAEPQMWHSAGYKHQKDKSMIRKISLLVVLGFVAIQSSCQRKSFDPALEGAFFPLRPGLSWTYRIVHKGRGNIDLFTDRVLGSRRVGSDESTGEVESLYYGPTGTLSSTIIYLSEDGYLTRQSRINKNVRITLSERAFLPQLLKPDLAWSNSLVPFDQQSDMFHVVQTHRTFFDSKTVEVPAGHFSGCIRIETVAVYESDSAVNLPMRLEYLDWYAPHVGLVKTVVRQSGVFGSELARIELINFGNSQPKSATSWTNRRSRVSSPEVRFRG
jgi:hypothetical protein